MTEFTKEQFEGENIKPGDRFTFYYSIPVHVAARPDQLQKDLTYYIKRVIDNPSIRYVNSKLSPDKSSFEMTVEVRPMPSAYTMFPQYISLSGMGVLPLVAWAAITAGISLIALLAKIGFGVFMLDRVVKITSNPIQSLNFGLIALIVAAVWLGPSIIGYLTEKERGTK